MTTVTIREVTGDELLSTARVVAEYAFGTSPSKPADPEEHRRRLQFRGNARTLVAFADEMPVATATLYPMIQSVRGALLPMGGIAAVASLPAARRLGYVRQMFAELYRGMCDAGMPVTTLYPFRSSFYERFGYTGFPAPRFATFDPAELGALVRIDKPGRVELLSMADGFDAWHAFLADFQPGVHGFALREEVNARRRQDSNDAWVLLARDAADRVIAAMTYRVTGYTEELRADTFYYHSSLGRYLLLDWIGRHVDQVKRAILLLHPDERPELWFRDLNAQSSTQDKEAWPAPMGRVLTVVGLTGIAAGDGAFTVRIADEHCPWNDGIYTFTGEGGALTVTEGGEPSGALTIQGLSALVYVGADPADFPFRGWGDPDESTRAAMRAVFPPATPQMHEQF